MPPLPWSPSVSSPTKKKEASAWQQGSIFFLYCQCASVDIGFTVPLQIEDGGKAAQCKKLKVGDELININGSTLYGSRQEALILIKGSYRVLKLAVRR